MNCTKYPSNFIEPRTLKNVKRCRPIIYLKKLNLHSQVILCCPYTFWVQSNFACIKSCMTTQPYFECLGYSDITHFSIIQQTVITPKEVFSCLLLYLCTVPHWSNCSVFSVYFSHLVNKLKYCEPRKHNVILSNSSNIIIPGSNKSCCCKIFLSHLTNFADLKVHVNSYIQTFSNPDQTNYFANHSKFCITIQTILNNKFILGFQSKTVLKLLPSFLEALETDVIVNPESKADPSLSLPSGNQAQDFQEKNNIIISCLFVDHLDVWTPQNNLKQIITYSHPTLPQ